MTLFFKKILCFSLTIFLCLNFSGCWNYKEISEKSIVAGAALDYDKATKELIITAEILAPTLEGKEGTSESSIISGRGDSLFNAIKDLTSKTGFRLFWSHCRILILSKDLFEDKKLFVGTLDWLNRDNEIRDDLYVIFSKEGHASDIFYNTEIKIQKIISFYLNDILENVGSISKFESVPLWESLDMLASQGISLSLPIVEIDTVGDMTTPKIKGCALFRGIEYVGSLDADETKGLLFAQDDLKGGLIEINKPISDSPTQISLEIISSETKVEPIFSSNDITMNMDIKLKVIIGESGSEFDFSKKSNREEIEKAGVEIIKNQIDSLIKKLQTEYKCDAIGFGQIVERENSELWKEISSDWNKEFSKVKTNIKANIDIRNSALRSEPIKIKE